MPGNQGEVSGLYFIDLLHGVDKVAVFCANVEGMSALLSEVEEASTNFFLCLNEGRKNDDCIFGLDKHRTVPLALYLRPYSLVHF